MKKLLSCILTAALLLSCLSALSFTQVFAAGEPLGKTITFLGERTDEQMYPVIRGSAGLSSLSEGPHTVSLMAYNENDFDITAHFYYQNGWGNIDGGVGVTQTIKAHTKKELSFTYTYANGKINNTEITPSNISIRVDVNSVTGKMPANSKFTFAYDGTAGVKNLEYSFNKGTEITVLPDLPFEDLTKKVENGDAENGLTGWGIFSSSGGSISLSEDTRTGSGHSVKFGSARDKYSSIGFSLGAAIVDDEANGYKGSGVGKYDITFYAKANKEASFSVIINSQVHKSPEQIKAVCGGEASDYVNTWTSGQGVTLTTQWKQYTVSIEVTQKYLSTIKALYKAGQEKAYDLILRLDGSSLAYKEELSCEYYMDDVAISFYSDVPVSTSKTGVVYTVTEEASSYWMVTQAGVFGEQNISDGFITVKTLVFNESDEDVQITPSIQTTAKKEDGSSTWAGFSGTAQVVLAHEHAWLTVSTKLNPDQTLTVLDKDYAVSTFFLRLDISAIPANFKFVVSCDEEVNGKYTNASTAKTTTKAATMDSKYDASLYPEETEDEPTTDLRINRALGNYMVLQRQKPIRIWGTSSKVGQTVTVSFKNKTTTATVQSDKTWEMYLPAEEADTTENTLTATCDGETFELTGILIGDVYLVGGQSNAEKTLSSCGKTYSADYKKDLVASANGMIRLFQQGRGDTTIPSMTYRMDSPQVDPIPHKKWQKESYFTANSFSAMGIFFAHKMYDELHIPIGLVMVASSGSPLSQLMSAEASKATNYTRFENDIPVSGMYNSLMHPFIKMSVKGMIFYQGESEMSIAYSDYGKYNVYLNAYVEDLRAKMGQNFPFYYVQVSSHGGAGLNSWKTLNEQRAVQFDGLKVLKNAGMVVSMDMGYTEGQTDWAHPDRKQPIGERLAALALCRDYNIGKEEYVTSPFPVYAFKTADGVVVRFKNVGDGLTKLGSYQTLTGFKAITDDAHHTYQNVDAEILNKTDVLLKTNSVQSLKGIAYGIELLAFTEYDDAKYIANLGNKSDLPAPTFKITEILAKEPVTDLVGDVDNDSDVDSDDITALARHLAMIETVNTQNADVNNDSKINSADLTALCKKVALIVK